MNYRETLDFLFSSLPMFQRTGGAAYKANLDNTIALDTVLDHPHRRFKTVHVAGTNGKGSVSHMLASILQEAGYKTGLYTSPHLVDFRERIRINGLMIGEVEVVDFVCRIRKEIERIQPSFFEMTVAMAFDHFAREEVDIAIIETGMGGRLDSTNIITPLLSLITSIAMDHAEFLGDTEVLIAREKGGIIKPGVPVIIGPNSDEVYGVFSEIAAASESRLLLSDRLREFRFQTFSADQTAFYHFHNRLSGRPEVIRSDLAGTYQHENIGLVLAAAGLLSDAGWDLPESALGAGLLNVQKNTGLRGRWEILGNNPRIIADTAHNEEGVRAVMQQLQQVPARKLHIVWGMVGDKPVEKIVGLLPEDAVYYFTRPSIPRAMPVERLVAGAGAAGLKGESFPTVADAYAAAVHAAGRDDTIFIGGSTFVVADLLQTFRP
jgi:dihydrofolate synthase / folylpolyglutamate synthase